MHHINVKQFGFAVAITITIIYVGCILVVSLVSTETAAAFFNSLMHGIDGSAIIRKTPTPLSEALIGVAEWFIIGWLIGASIAAVYNVCNKFHKTT